MGVYIRDMKMPYSCLPCACQKWDMCGVTGNNVTTEIALQKRRADCPLVEIDLDQGGDKSGEKET